MNTSKILIVDDDSRNIFALKAILKSRGYTVTDALCAKDAINQMQNDKNIGIVLLDMMMPEMDGYEALHAIQANASIAHLPVIAVTAQAMAGDREKCLAAGAAEYVSKPIDIEKLETVLQQYML